MSFSIRFLLLLALACSSVSALAQRPPTRLASMNVCTDQLLLMLAPRAHILSLSHLATDPRVSAMADQAKGILPNRGLAEEIYLLSPDLVVAGQYTAQAGVAMLEQLGIRVMRLKTANTLRDIRENTLQLATALGTPQRAAGWLEQLDDSLRRAQALGGARPRAALFSANGYTSGSESLAGQILYHAGFDNIADEVGLRSGGFLSLEHLVVAQPQVLIGSAKYPGSSRAEAILDHPALKAFAKGTRNDRITDHNWVCGTPKVAVAIDKLVDLRRSLDKP